MANDKEKSGGFSEKKQLNVPQTEHQANQDTKSTNNLTVPFDSSARRSSSGSNMLNYKKLSSTWSDVIAKEDSFKKRKVEKRRNAVTNVDAGLSEDTLRKLAQMFREADKAGKGSLNLDQFKEVLRKLLFASVTDEELEIMYMKTDSNCDGAVDWDEYLNFILLECKEKDKMAIQAQQPFQDSPRLIYSSIKMHKDSVVAIFFQKISSKRKGEKLGRYITIDKDGGVVFWNQNFEVINKHKLQSENKMVWVTDACLMENINLIAIATTARTVNFCDITGNRFVEQSRIVGLDACPTCIHYWCSPIDAEKSVLLFGDDRGGVTVTIFKTCPLQTKFNSKKMGSRKHLEKIHVAVLLKGSIPFVKALCLPNIHVDSVTQIAYVPHLGAFLSCSRDRDTAMCLCNFDFDFSRKVMKVFRVRQGVQSFDWSQHLNMIVTGGYDALIRVWNPYILSRPSSILYGHQSPLLVVKINAEKEHVISVSENKEIRIHDLNSQTCIQRFYKSMFPDLGKKLITGFYFNAVTQDCVIATTTLAVLDGMENMWRNAESMSQLDPVAKTIFNALFNVVVSACWNGTITVWDFRSGKLTMQYKAYDENHKPFDSEITAMSFDPSKRRLMTSSKVGCLRIWNFNNGDLLHELPNIENMEISSLVWDRQRIITGGWSQRVVITLETVDDYMISILNPYHKEDVMSLACYRSNILASGCYNGDVYLWHLETGRMMGALNTSSENCRAVSTRKHTGIRVQNPSIHYATLLEKDPKKLQELLVLPCYLRSCKEDTDADHHSSSDEDENDNFNKHSSIAATTSSKHSSKASRSSTGTIKGSSIFCSGKYSPKTSSMKSRASNTSSHSEYDALKYAAFKNKIKNDRKSSSAIEKIVFLENRESNADTAILVLAAGDGMVSAWSLHPNGGLKGKFQASYEENEPITAMMYIQDQELLVTGDFSGYIRVWDINHFCKENSACNTECQNKWSHFRFVKFKRCLYLQGRYHYVFPHLKNDSPHLITAYRGHTKTITWLEYVPNVSGQELFISSSLDCSVRLWTLQGEFLGLYGQALLWNLKDIDLPLWRDGSYVDFESTQSQSIIRKKGENSVILPADIRKVASATTMTVLLSGKRNLWQRVRTVLHMIYKMRRRQRLFSKVTPVTDDLLQKSYNHQQTETKHVCNDELDIPALLKECEAKRKELPKKNQILGMNYKRQVNHRPLPILKKPLSMEPQCAIYRALPYYQLEEITNPMDIPEIRTVRKTFSLPPISREPKENRNNRFTTQNRPLLMAHLNQQLRKATLVPHLSVVPDIGKPTKYRGPPAGSRRATLVTPTTLLGLNDQKNQAMGRNIIGQEAGDSQPDEYSEATTVLSGMPHIRRNTLPKQFNALIEED